MKKLLLTMLPIYAVLTAIFSMVVWPPFGVGAQKNTPIDTIIAGPASPATDTIVNVDIERVGRKVELLKENTIRISQGSQKTDMEVTRLEKDVRSMRKSTRISNIDIEEDWTDTTMKYFPSLKSNTKPTHYIIQRQDCDDCNRRHNFWYRLKHLF